MVNGVNHACVPTRPSSLVNQAKFHGFDHPFSNYYKESLSPAVPPTPCQLRKPTLSTQDHLYEQEAQNFKSTVVPEPGPSTCGSCGGESRSEAQESSSA